MWQLFISRMRKMRAIPQLVSAPLNPWYCFWLVVSCERHASANQKHYPDLGSGLSALVSQTSFWRETSGGIVECQLFTQASVSSVNWGKDLMVNYRKNPAVFGLLKAFGTACLISQQNNRQMWPNVPSCSFKNNSRSDFKGQWENKFASFMAPANFSALWH